MYNIIKESTLRYLRKNHKDWTDERINAEAKRIWEKYVEENKTVLEEKAKFEKKAMGRICRQGICPVIFRFIGQVAIIL